MGRAGSWDRIRACVTHGRSSLVGSALLLMGQSTASKTHRLEATPATVAYGYYWSEAKPVLRIASGDIVDVDTLLTSTPDRLEKSGVPAAEVQASLRAIVSRGQGSRAGRAHPHGPGVCRRGRAG